MFKFEPIAAPFTPISGICINIIFDIIFTINPAKPDIAGIAILPNPCSAPFAVCASIENITVNALI